MSIYPCVVPCWRPIDFSYMESVQLTVAGDKMRRITFIYFLVEIRNQWYCALAMAGTGSHMSVTELWDWTGLSILHHRSLLYPENWFILLRQTVEFETSEGFISEHVCSLSYVVLCSSHHQIVCFKAKEGLYPLTLSRGSKSTIQLCYAGSSELFSFAWIHCSCCIVMRFFYDLEASNLVTATVVSVEQVLPRPHPVP
jgi:hypothetical protein